MGNTTLLQGLKLELLCVEFPPGSLDSSHYHKHAGRQNNYVKLPLGENEYVIVCVRGAQQWGEFFHIMPSVS